VDFSEEKKYFFFEINLATTCFLAVVGSDYLEKTNPVYLKIGHLVQKREGEIPNLLTIVFDPKQIYLTFF